MNHHTDVTSSSTDGYKVLSSDIHKPQHITFEPDTLDLQVGNLTIKASQPTLCRSQILLDGHPHSVRAITITGGVNQPWTVEMSYFPTLAKPHASPVP